MLIITVKITWIFATTKFLKRHESVMGDHTKLPVFIIDQTYRHKQSRRDSYPKA